MFGDVIRCKLRTFACAYVTTWVLVLPAGLAIAQSQDVSTQPPKHSKEADLTEGLLDLVKEPEPDREAATSASSRSTLVPSDVGLEGEVLDEQSSSPLQSVRQSMFIAAGLLQRGVTGTDTQRLQSDIVVRLDELIEQLEKTPQNQNQNQSSEKDQQKEQVEREQKSQQQSRQSSSQSSTTSQSESSQTSDDAQQPGVNGREATAEVQISDPRALQEDVWGHLPDRLRTQMQSKMVEQFLPSYREQIEAYFRALLDDR